MSFDAYNPDSICWAFGVGRLDPGPVSDGWVLRLLLMPSFHAEVCVTLRAPAHARGSAEVLVPAERVWPTVPIPQFMSRAAAELDAELAVSLPAQIPAQRPDSGRAITIDGMPFAAVLRLPGGARTIEGVVPGTGEESDWICQLLVTLHARIEDVRCKRGLAQAGIYAGLALACPEPEDAPPPIRIGVLGSADEREDLVRAMSAFQARRKKPDRT
jgi:hypothetical protein